MNCKLLHKIYCEHYNPKIGVSLWHHTKWKTTKWWKHIHTLKLQNKKPKSWSIQLKIFDVVDCLACIIAKINVIANKTITCSIEKVWNKYLHSSHGGMYTYATDDGSEKMCIVTWSYTKCILCEFNFEMNKKSW